ncbi:hypothetical protein CO038_01015 [Candidatus Pacearchaeota archaeon CG_4_9_14_0_2_um_filter_39_13]|nr:hypothetical protein [Candidatus Pacearchaeota archaeon]OIO43108.1 MAG: hypothetical protein AUJ64_02910 [Candidatus Pacearchaeota archaeon CG1_02_39_14]PJC44956.1 MAG: hypothetical protein CO038_01015 [Candidatus Pacearchaeota archaeon CG_4_9_14_0_2_um_filter_39_13]
MKKKKASKSPVKKPALRKKKPESKKSSKVQTGVSVLDSLIQGGFERNSTNMIVGSSGSGKSILATQFLMGGIKKGESCLYVTFEEKKEEFFSNMKKFGWDLEEYEKKGLLTFLEYTPIKVKTMLEEGGGAIESIILRKKISRMVIDSITSFALLFDDELEKREAALSLFNMISDWNCTSLLTLETEPPKSNQSTTHTLEFEADSIILLHYIRSKGQRERYLEVLKMRGTDHSTSLHKIDIGKSGITIQKSGAKTPSSL